jgi:hypothetical protein
LSDARAVPVIAGKRCIGFLLSCGPCGIAAFDRDEKPIGVFGTPIEAAVAVEKAAAIKSTEEADVHEPR